MQDYVQLFKKYPWQSLMFAGFILAYLLQVLLPAPDPAALARYHISASSAKILGLTIAIPYIIIWLIALYGYLRLHSYAKTIADTKDGRGFMGIAKGLWLLVLWAPLSVLLSGYSRLYYRQQPEDTAWLIWINNYFTLVLLFFAFLLIYQGTKQLLSVVKTPTYMFYQWTTCAYLAFAALYTFLVLHDPVRSRPDGDVVSTYYAPDWVIVVTIVIPRLIAWYLGVQAVQNILLYRRKVKGALYKKALQGLAKGLGATVLMIIILRIIQSLSVPLGKLNIAVLMLVIYLLLAAIAVGYAYIARGARKLHRIEEL